MEIKVIEERRKRSKYYTKTGPIKEVIRALVHLVVSFFIMLFCFLVYLPTREEGITKRKIRRIRFFTKVKKFIYKHFKRECDYIELGAYMRNLNKRL